MGDADKESPKSTTAPKTTGWSHKRGDSRLEKYDPWARNPSYAGGDAELTWEFASARRHYHPSVRKFADDIVAKSKEKYPGDPLADFTTIRFLDRFVYKNPKKSDEKRKINVNHRRRNTYLDTTQLPVTSLTFLQKQQDELPPTDRYLHHFFQLRSNGSLSNAILDGQLRGW